MAKRMTDSNKWEDPWFQDLPSKYKLFWLYLLDKCDHAGIWEVNFKNASFFIGEHLEVSEVKRILSGRINFLNDKYWLITKFIHFQYGGIKTDQVGRSVMQILIKHDILSLFEPLPSPSLGSIDKDKVKDMVNVLGTGKNYILIQKKYLTSEALRVCGKDGLIEYYEMNKSIINYPQYADKFMRDRNGKTFNDFQHLWNDYNLFVDKQNSK